jgi:hypothetical protein
MGGGLSPEHRPSSIRWDDALAKDTVHVCFSFKVGNTPHKAAMRSMELMIGEVKPRIEKALT